MALLRAVALAVEFLAADHLLRRACFVPIGVQVPPMDWPQKPLKSVPGGRLNCLAINHLQLQAWQVRGSNGHANLHGERRLGWQLATLAG
jgi:hypothetical protein